MAVVGILYLAIVYLSKLAFDIPFSVFVFVLILVILSHSLYEWGSISLERLFYRRQYAKVKENLRALSREAMVHDSGKEFQRLLDTLCTTFSCARGWFGIREENQWSGVAAHPPAHLSPPSLDLLADEIVLVDGWAIIPLYARGIQVGVIVLGGRSRNEMYTEEELDVLDNLADQLAGVIYTTQQQSMSIAQIDALVEEFRTREQSLQAKLEAVLDSELGPTVSEDSTQMRQLVEDALRHLDDYDYLGEHALAQLKAVTPYLADHTSVITHLDRGRALRQLLVGLIERLRPLGEEPRQLSREWTQYTILYDAYVLGELNRDIMSKLYISESGFNRARRRAVRGVTKALEEMERAARTST
jgi:hypothetical protein